jgi:hypothetical protein
LLPAQVRILELDGSLEAQTGWQGRCQAEVIDACHWGPSIRLACSFRGFERFACWANAALAIEGPTVWLYGSGDFHHVTLALLQRVAQPFHLLVLDKHPDWMGGIPFLHCGTWLRHALHLKSLQRVFHCGGMADFDNGYRHLAPWRDLRSGRIQVFPAERLFMAGWSGIRQYPLLDGEGTLGDRLRKALEPFADELARHPLYVSIDKDVLVADDAAVNWDSGSLRLTEASAILSTFLELAGGRWIGADLLGDWSPVHLGHWLNRACHRLDHPSPEHHPAEAAERNGRANRVLLDALLGPGGSPSSTPGPVI